MMRSKLVALALLTASVGNYNVQNTRQSQNFARKEVSLNRANDGQRICASVGQPIVVTLQTIGGGNYDTPQVSSRAVRFESAVYPREQNPGRLRVHWRSCASDRCNFSTQRCQIVLQTSSSGAWRPRSQDAIRRCGQWSRRCRA